MYEMAVGVPPFMNANKIQLMKTIINKGVDFSKVKGKSLDFKNLLRRLLTHDQTKRIGSSESGAEEVKSHAFFKNVDWDKVREKEVPVPFKPQISSDKDISNIDKSFLKEKPVDSICDSKD